jgi:hypothetical protein
MNNTKDHDKYGKKDKSISQIFRDLGISDNTPMNLPQPTRQGLRAPAKPYDHSIVSSLFVFFVFVC